jgi:hypothetical protein
MFEFMAEIITPDKSTGKSTPERKLYSLLTDIPRETNGDLLIERADLQ